jgi:hypothetical protein
VAVDLRKLVGGAAPLAQRSVDRGQGGLQLRLGSLPGVELGSCERTATLSGRRALRVDRVAVEGDALHGSSFVWVHGARRRERVSLDLPPKTYCIAVDSSSSNPTTDSADRARRRCKGGDVHALAQAALAKQRFARSACRSPRPQGSRTPQQLGDDAFHFGAVKKPFARCVRVCFDRLIREIGLFSGTFRTRVQQPLMPYVCLPACVKRGKAAAAWSLSPSACAPSLCVIT